ncbi:nuclear transport factor 2 family protein [Flavobacteriaceae bacterium AH-315-B10]|nr:nuclear transport factor 2 family protein [Flavobacteriaceae bacterium AH-315-B10]
MKTNLKAAFIIIFAVFISGCDNDDQTPEPDLIDLINTQFPEAEQEILQTFGEIAQSIIDGDMDKLISFHAYSPKFTEFKNGEPRNGSAANEAYEREVFGAITEVVKFEANDLKIAVYGNVANLTFHSNFHLYFGADLVIVNDQISLLFVKTIGGWKMVHEHHSPLN